MIMEAVKVTWPETLALFYTPLGTAYHMSFDHEASLKATLDLNPDRPRSSDVPIETVFHCTVVDAFYCPGIYAIPEEGKEAPEGRLGLYENGELLAEGSIASFVLGVKPRDCMGQLFPWKSTKHQYPAVPLIKGDADTSRQIGVMFTNNDRVEVRVSDLNPREKMTLEVGLFAALYSTRNITPKTPMEKLVAAAKVLRQCRGKECEAGAWNDFVDALILVEDKA